MRRISKGIATLTMAGAPENDETSSGPALTTSNQVAWVAQRYPGEGPADGGVDPPPAIAPEQRRRRGVARSLTSAGLAGAAIGVLLVAGSLAASNLARSGQLWPVGAASVVQRPADERPGPDTAPLVGQEERLDAYVAAAQPQLADVAASFRAKFSDIRIAAVHPGTVQYDYVFAVQMDPTIAAAALDASIPTLKATADSAVFPEMARAGITTAAKVTYTYYNADGTEIWTHTFNGP